MSAWRQSALATAVLVLAACHVGPQVNKTDLGVRPNGANVVVQTGKAREKKVEHNGELLEVRDDGLLILTHAAVENDSRIILIPWRNINRVSASDMPGIAVRASQGDKQRKVATDKLRNVSRFPQGLSSEFTARLLARYEQSELDTIE